MIFFICASLDGDTMLLTLFTATAYLSGLKAHTVTNKCEQQMCTLYINIEKRATQLKYFGKPRL